MAKEDVRIRMAVEGAQQTQASIRGVTRAVTGLVTALASKEVVQHAVAMSRLSASYNGALRAATNFAEQGGMKIEEMLITMRKAARGQIDELTLLQNYLKGVQLGVPFEAISTAIEFSVLQAAASGREVMWVYDQLMEALAKQSGLRLDNVNLKVQDGVDFTKRAVAEMRRQIPLLESDANNANAAYDRFTASFENAQIRIGKLIEKDLAGWLADVAHGLDQVAATPLDRTIRDLEEMGLTSEAIEPFRYMKQIEDLRKQQEWADKIFEDAKKEGSRRDLTFGKQASSDDGAGWRRRRVAKLSETRDASAIQETLREVMQAAPENNTAEMNRLTKLLRQMLVAVKIDSSAGDAIDDLEKQIAGIPTTEEVKALNDNLKKNTSERLADQARSTTGQPLLPQLDLESDIPPDEVIKLFQESLRSMNNDVALGTMTLNEMSEAVERWKKSLMSAGEEGEETYKEARIDLDNRLTLQLNKNSTERRNLILAETDAILQAEEGTYEQRLEAAYQFVAAALAAEEWLADDKEALVRRLAEITAAMDQEQAEAARFTAGQLQSLFGGAMDSIVDDFLRGEVSAKKFFTSLAIQITKVALQLAVVNALINTLIPGAGLPTLGTLFSGFAGVPKAAHGITVPARAGGTAVIMGEAGEEEYGIPRSRLMNIVRDVAMTAPPAGGGFHGQVIFENLLDGQTLVLKTVKPEMDALSDRGRA